MTIDRLLKIAEAESVSVIGIAPASSMADERQGYGPADILPDAQRLIAFGIAVPHGVYETAKYPLESVWRTQNLIYRRLDTISVRISNLLEECGATCVPVYGCMPLDLNDKGTVVGILNQIQMAETAGIGVIGKNGLLLHSRYGARLMLGGLLTTAHLAVKRYPDEAESGCPPECRICADVCPVSAIMPEKKKVKIMRCLNYTARTPFMSKLKFFYLRVRDKAAAARYMSITSFDEHTFHVCSKCVSCCPYGSGK